MLIDKRAGVIGGTQLDAFEMAFFATERVIDLRMANEAVRHLWQVCLARQVGFLKIAMAGLTGAYADEALTDPVTLAQIGSPVDSGDQHRSDVTQLQVGLVVELVASFGGWYFGKSGCVHGPDRAAAVANVALPLGWQIAVHRRGAGRGFGMAAAADSARLQMNAVRGADLGGRQRDRSGPVCPKGHDEGY